VVKERIRSAQRRAAIAVNPGIGCPLLDWQIGREILTRQQREGWGAKVIDHLAADLRPTFPETTCLSLRNLKYMRVISEAWPEEQLCKHRLHKSPGVTTSPC
jgi:hypothetical protein